MALVFAWVVFKAFKAVSNPMNKKREEFQSKSKREKIFLSIEQALVWAAIWSVIGGLQYCFATYADRGSAVSGSAVFMALSVEMIVMATLGSLIRDWLYYGRVKSAAWRQHMNQTYGFTQSTEASPTSPHHLVNVDGSPMVGLTDINGNPYGVSQ